MSGSAQSEKLPDAANANAGPGADHAGPRQHLNAGCSSVEQGVDGRNGLFRGDVSHVHLRD